MDPYPSMISVEVITNLRVGAYLRSVAQLKEAVSRKLQEVGKGCFDRTIHDQNDEMKLIMSDSILTVVWPSTFPLCCTSRELGFIVTCPVTLHPWT